jgi:beta-galactosidase
LPLTFKDMDLDYGFMLYSTEIKYTDDAKRSVTIEGLQDRAIIFVNGEYIGCIMRDRKQEPLIFDVPKEGAKLDILVENMGRVNYGCAMINEYKGICGYVRIEIVCEDGSLYPWNYAQKMKWTNIALPCDDMSKIDFNISPKANRPTVLEGSFKAQPGVDTFFNPIGWEKGFVEINGFNIGRYWSVGPQGTLYVPGELLKEDNVIFITELQKVPEDMTVRFDDKPSLDTIEKSCDLCVSVVG